jgi:hypothetical protein
MENEVIKLVEERGPLLGSEIWEAVGGDRLSLWRTCKLSKNLIVRTVATHYLRLDRRVEGFGRISPSILREFLTYSVVGPLEAPNSLDRRARQVAAHIEDVSRSKLELAYRVVSSIAGDLEVGGGLDQQACFTIAGDIVYNMAHDVGRPERSTGKTVNGSDMDIVVITDDGCPDELMRRLDAAIYEEKSRLLMAPHLREEIDYVVKKLDRVREQVRFDTFRRMVACKILHEATFLYGSETVFRSVKDLLRECGVVQKLDDIETRARAFRLTAEDYLLQEDPGRIKEEGLCFFYPTEESEEFE